MATVFVAISMLATVVVVVLIIQFSVASSEVAQVRNQTDLAALSGAQLLMNGESEEGACSHVLRVLRDYQVDCAVEGENVVLNIEARNPFSWLSETIKAHAKAGPVIRPLE
ncbi:flp pilus-assembly TadE/G-like family protein [Arcanobacterium ihumii]|uniref:flp pilus-assembly TadE/G-like family protein n=1 Tax=Arcanobacterium ihumii TaxID=2138162 RepID=UPI00135B53F9|nr:flp pilus-assembly TadE/G-like family protein [Arcanobacterium ihumii]